MQRAMDQGSQACDNCDLKTTQNRQIKIKLRSLKSSEQINEKRDGPYRGLYTGCIPICAWKTVQ